MSGLIVRSSAQRDIADAAEWYEDQRQALGENFLEEIDRAFRRIAANPLQFPGIGDQVRRALLHRFPYAIYFVTVAEVIEIIAVLHQHRDPKTWTMRR